MDRVDYIKGIPQKLLAVESLLEAHPEYVGRVVLLQIAVPTRTDVPEYQKLRATAHRIVGRINGRFGSVGYVPIHYLDKSVAFEELCDLPPISHDLPPTSHTDLPPISHRPPTDLPGAGARCTSSRPRAW